MMYTVHVKPLDKPDKKGNSSNSQRAPVVFGATSLEEARAHILKSGRVLEPTSARDFKDGEILFIKHDDSNGSSGDGSIGGFPADLFVMNINDLGALVTGEDGWLECCAVSETVPAGWFTGASSIQKLKLVAFWSISVVPSTIIESWMKTREEREKQEAIIRAFDKEVPTAKMLNYCMPINSTISWGLESMIDGDPIRSEAIIRHIYQMHYAAKICLGEKIGGFVWNRLRVMSAKSYQALKEWCESEIVIAASHSIKDEKGNASYIVARPDLVNLITAMACLSTKCIGGSGCHHRLGFYNAAKAGDTLGLINHFMRVENNNKQVIRMQMAKLGFNTLQEQFTVPVTYDMARALDMNAIVP